MPGRERRRSRPGPNRIAERAAIKCALKPLTDEPQGPGSTQPGRSLPPATAARRHDSLSCPWRCSQGNHAQPPGRHGSFAAPRPHPTRSSFDGTEKWLCQFPGELGHCVQGCRTSVTPRPRRIRNAQRPRDETPGRPRSGCDRPPRTTQLVARLPQSSGKTALNWMLCASSAAQAPGPYTRNIRQG